MNASGPLIAFSGSTLLVNGTVGGSGQVVVQGGALLAGNGMIEKAEPPAPGDRANSQKAGKSEPRA